jgi:carbon storage regulator CsrA
MSRKPEETIVIDGGRVVITVLEIHKGAVRLGVEAPKSVIIHRGEVQARINAADELVELSRIDTE